MQGRKLRPSSGTRLLQHQRSKGVVSNQATVTVYYYRRSIREETLFNIPSRTYSPFSQLPRLLGALDASLLEPSKNADARHASQCSRRRPERGYRMVSPLMHSVLQSFANRRGQGTTSSESTASSRRSPRRRPP